MHRSPGKGNGSIVLQICLSNFRKWSWNPRIITIALFVIFILWTEIEPVREYVAGRGLSISCWYFPIIFTNNMRKIFLYFGVILLFCNAPFVDEQQMYVLHRSGRKNWFLGEILYIMLASALYFFFIYLVSIAEFFPYVGFSTEWEKILVELSQNRNGNSILVSPEIIRNFTPFQAMALAYLINVALAILLGLVIFYVNLWKSRGYGVAVALFWVFFAELAESFCIIMSALLYLSPLSWCNLEHFCEQYGGIKLSYVCSFLVICGIVLSALIMHKSKSYNIEAMEEI